MIVVLIICVALFTLKMKTILLSNSSYLQDDDDGGGGGGGGDINISQEIISWLQLAA